MRATLTLLLLLLIPLLYPRRAWAFAELVRHNYVNCISCHVSPSGGGVLTPYGRELSREILSTWGRKSEQESQFAYGLVAPPEWLSLMGMYRGVLVRQHTPFVTQSRYIYMEGDLEGAATIAKKLILDATLGYENMAGDTTALDHVIARRFYANYRPTDELSLRFGRFDPQFGLTLPDHVVATKRGLGFDEGTETYNLEGAYLGDQWNVYLTGIFGRIDKPSLNREQGVALSPSLAIADHYKVGLSYYYGNGPRTTRSLAGPWGILGFTPHFFLLTELDGSRQWSRTATFAPKSGVADYNRLDYELVQGLHVYVTQDLARLDWNDPRGLSNSWGAGVQFFPRPHFELNASWQKLRTMSVSSNYTDFAWLMLNFYL